MNIGVKFHPPVIVLILILLFSITPLYYCDEYVSPEKEIEGFKISFRLPHPPSSKSVLASESWLSAAHIAKSIVALKSEIDEFYIPQGAHLEFTVAIGNQEKWYGLTGFVLKVSSQGIVFSNSILKISLEHETGKNPFLTMLKIHDAKIIQNEIIYLKIESLDQNPVMQNICEIYNLNFDAKKNILDRVILRSTRDPSLASNETFLKFQEGKWIEYRDFNERSLPGSYTYKTFILTKDGQKLWMKVKNSLNRRFNENGWITQESTKETSYTYANSNAAETYAIYNVMLHPKGELESYEIVFPKIVDAPFSEEEHIAINITRNEKGALLKKMIRKYKITDHLKQYIEGKSHEFLIDERSRIRSAKEITFDIKAGTKGILLDEQILKEELDLWNFTFDDKDQILSRRILQSSFDYPIMQGTKSSLHLFHSLKNIHITRDLAKDTLNELQIDYWDFSDDKRLVVDRRIKIQILETMITGEPTKIKLTIESPINPASNAEEIIIQDCNYIINQAISGDLFYQKKERSFDVHMEDISENGDILKVIFYHYTLENGIKQYTTKEERLMPLNALQDKAN